MRPIAARALRIRNERLPLIGTTVPTVASRREKRSVRPFIAVLAAGLLASSSCVALAHGLDTQGKPATAKGHAPVSHGEAFGEPGDPKAKARMIQLTMNDDMRIVPGRVTATRGETIRFMVENDGGMKHEIVLGTQDELLEHAKLMQEFPEMEHEDPNMVGVEPGKTGVLLWKFTNSGTFMFGCLIPGHFESGMKGTIVVK